MARHKNMLQDDLFGAPKSAEVRYRIKELDEGIAKAMKRGDFEKARLLTGEQQRLLQDLVEGEDNA
jgi:hypothetical protein